jgi:diadenosine tetraphosphate (Ap4A) HIT family hydrolase
MPVSSSPFHADPEEEWLCGNELCFAFFDQFPVSVGHVLVVTRRVVATWFEASAEEQAGLMGLVNGAPSGRLRRFGNRLRRR